MKIAVLCDSACAMSKQECNDLGIYYLPLQVVLNEKTYLDGVDLTISDVNKMLEEKMMPTTSMPVLGMMHEILQQIKDDGYDAIVCVPLTSGLSSTASALVSSAEAVGIKMALIDCYTTCVIQKYIVLEAKKLVDQGLDLDTIVNKLETSLSRSNTLIIPDDLEHLKRGGRLTPLAAALGGLLKIKPILQLNRAVDGKIDTCDKVRTMSKAMSRAIDILAEDVCDDDVLFVASTGDTSDGDKLEALMHERFPNNEIIRDVIGPVISVHTGLNCLGIQRIARVK